MYIKLDEQEIRVSKKARNLFDVLSWFVSSFFSLIYELFFYSSLEGSHGKIHAFFFPFSFGYPGLGSRDFLVITTPSESYLIRPLQLLEPLLELP